MTGKAYNQRSNIAIVLDEIVYSAPGVSSGAISGGRSEITGNFTLNEATDLANVLRAGKLPASANIIQSEIVGPSLGKEAVQAGIYSFLIALIIVLIWMVFYYGSSGIFADIALLAIACLVITPFPNTVLESIAPDFKCLPSILAVDGTNALNVSPKSIAKKIKAKL